MNRTRTAPVTTKVARAHHYVPEFYLAGFTLSGSREDMLWVFDQEQDKHWQARPKKIAHERDFYRVDIDGVEPDAVEKALAQFEGQVADVFRKIGQSRELPEGDDFDFLINFVALQATRVPYHRQWYEEQAAHLSKWRVQMALSHPPFFEKLAADMRREGNELPDSITREELLEFLEDESRYTIEIPQESSIQHMVDMAEGLLPVLAQRSWSLAVAQDERHDFICSDRPVMLAPTEPDPPPFLGFGMPKTEVILPLNRQMALVGHYGGESQTFDADQGVVGLFNHRTLHFAERFLYSARESFPVTVLREAAGSSTP